MANSNSEKLLQVRLQEKIDTLANWQKVWGTFKPLKGEKILFQIWDDPTTTAKEADLDHKGAKISSTNPPQVISKTGDGVTTLENLPWDSALAADVYSWAKEENLKYDDLPKTLRDEIDALQANNKKLTIKDGSTEVVSYDPSKAKEITLTDGDGVVVNGTTGKIEVKGVAAGDSLGVVKTGGVATISNGEITKISDATNAVNADHADDAGKLTVNAGSTIKPVYFTGGVPTEIGYTIQSNVPADAKFTDTNDAVTQTDDTSTNSDFPLLIKNSANTTTETKGVKSASKVTINPNTGIISTKGASIDGALTADDIDTGTLDASGNVTIGGTLAVTGAITGSLSGNATTATTAEKTQAALTFGTKSFNGKTAQSITAADLGLSTALKFKGVADALPTSDMAVGDVWIVNKKEYVYAEKNDTNKTKYWEELGDPDALSDAVGGIQNITIDAGAELTWSGKLGSSPKIDHDVKLTGGFTGTSAATTVTAGAGTKTIKIPKLTVNQYGHVTGASEVDLKITVPSIPTLSGGSAADPDTSVVGGVSVDGHTVTVQKKTVGVANTDGVLEVTGDVSNVKIGFKSANRGANDVLFGDETWHGHDSYIVLCGGSATENV